METFYHWITKYRNERSSRGDLAKDIVADPEFPRNATDKFVLLDYLQSQYACLSCISVFESVYDTYLAETDKVM